MIASVAPPSPWLGLRIMRVLPGIDPATLRDVLRLARIVRFGRGDPLASQGDEPAVFMLLEGYVSARRTSSDGQRYTSLILRPGHVTGLEAIARAVSSTDDLIGLSDGIAISMAGEALRNVAARDAGLALRLFDLGAGMAKVIAQRLDQSVFDSAHRRVATILLAYEDLLSGVSPVISRTELASLAGTSREMLGLVIRALEAEGAIRREGRSIVVDDRNLLHEHAAWESCGAEHSTALTVPPSPPPVRAGPRTLAIPGQIALFPRSPDPARSRPAESTAAGVSGGPALSGTARRGP